MAASPHEVIIVGGGPAGSACAAAILRRRRDLAGRIVILERARHPRQKPCGGGLTGHVPAALEALGLRLAVPHVPSPSAHVAFFGMRRQVALDRPVCVVRREEFDHSLLVQAQALGAEVREGVALRSYAVRDGGVRAVTTSGVLCARVLVGADGAGSVVRKQLLGHREGAGPRPLRLFRAEIAGRSPYRDAMLYDFTPMARGLRGYLWIFPVPGGRINVGVMHYQGRRTPSLSGAALAALSREALRGHGIELEEGALRGWPAWGYSAGASVAAPHVCLVGDAAGIDALTGEGIAVALQHGAIAGAAVCDGLAAEDLSFSDYGRRLGSSEVGRELTLDRHLAWLLYDHAASGYRRWLSMVMLDEELLALYASRVSGTNVLSDHKLRLLRILLRHVPRLPSRLGRLASAESPPSASA